MKKILLFVAIIAIAFSVSACTSKPASISDQNNSPLGFQDDQYSIDQNTINSNLAENTNSAPDTNITTNDASQTVGMEIPVQNSITMLSPDKQENLLKTYSSAIIKTTEGNITVKFYGNESPVTVNNFLNLAKAGFYNGTKFHRIIKDFMIQGGDPLSKESNSSAWGTGGPGYQFKDEFNTHKLVFGSLAMANSGPNTNGSQFFIVTIPETPWLDGKHTNFGQVTGGLDIVKKIEGAETGVNDRPTTDIVINSIELLK